MSQDLVTAEPQRTRVTKFAPVPEYVGTDPEHKTPKQRALAGHYRMIHGSILIPRPWSEWHNPDGSEIEGVSRTVRAGVHVTKVAQADDLRNNITAGDPIEWVGDEVWLDDEEAARLMDQGMIEPLDAKPSMVGKMWLKPKPNPRPV